LAKSRQAVERRPCRLPDRDATAATPGRTRLNPETGDLHPASGIDDLATARIVVSSSDAFGVATPLQIEPWLRKGEHRVLPFDAPWIEPSYGFSYLKNRMLSPAAESYMARVREIEAELRDRNRALLDEMASAH
jgi:DNA-binding transcriptional LysR family regulator